MSDSSPLIYQCTYTVRAEFDDGYAETTLAVNKSGIAVTPGEYSPSASAASAASSATSSSAGSVTSSATGDSVNLWIWLSLMGASSVLAVTLITGRKRKLRSVR